MRRRPGGFRQSGQLLSEYTFRRKPHHAVHDGTISLIFLGLNRFVKETITEMGNCSIIGTDKDDGRGQGREWGHAEGLQAGIGQGSLEAASRVAKAMHADGEPAERVCRLTGLTLEQINALM